MQSGFKFFLKNQQRLGLGQHFNPDTSIRDSNKMRVAIIIPISIIISVSIVFFNLTKLHTGTSMQTLWLQGVVLLNKGVSAIFIFLIGLFYFFEKKIREKDFLSEILITGVIIVLPFWGTIGCLLDQQNNPSLIPLFIAFVIVSFGLLIRPWIAMLVFGINYAVFYFGLAVTQSNAQLLGFNRLAGFWCMATSIGLSIIFWRNNLIKLKHKKIIEEQGNELQANYNQLIETTAELKKSMSAKDHFFSILSHDLRGPLTSTLSLTQMITENSFGGDENEKHNAMKLIESTLQNSIALFDDILVWSATQSNRMPFIQENLHLRDVVNNNMQLLMLGAHKKSLVLVNQINNDFWINADRNMLNTILRNLLANAIKFSNQGGKIEIFAAIHIEQTTGKRLVTISVKDEGVGIAEKVLKSLFKIEHKITTLGTHKETGTGLGLILCKELAEKQHGSISVESKTGLGSTFMVHLPAL